MPEFGPTVLTVDDIDRVAVALAEATRSAKPIPPLTDTWPRLPLQDAYAIQLRGVQTAVQSGQRVIGYKIGLTSPAMQAQFGVPEPDFGHLLDRMQPRESGFVPVSTLCAPRAEPEIAFVLEGAIAAPGATTVEVLDATDYLLPAIEVVDSRFEDWRITIADTVADNASSGRFVLGGPPVRVGDMDLSDTAVALAVNGSVVRAGSTGAVLGNPATAVAWLANTLAALGVQMEAGDVILSGSCTAAVPVRAGDTVAATFGGVDAVTVRFI
jgi:2-keto-4-pentenoate hydratase